jgi:hypothetical protein
MTFYAMRLDANGQPIDRVPLVERRSRCSVGASGGVERN